MLSCTPAAVKAGHNLLYALPFQWKAPAISVSEVAAFPLLTQQEKFYYYTHMLSKAGAAFLAVVVFFLTACGAKKVSTPDEIHQRQQEITKEVADKYGFPDVSVRIIDAGKSAPPVITDGEIVSQEVQVRLGEIRQPDDPRETCYGIVVWRLRSPPDLISNNGNAAMMQTETNYQKVKDNAAILGLADCFAP